MSAGTQANAGTAQLASDIAERRATGQELPVLFLGAACSRAADAKRILDIAGELFGQLREDADLATPDLPPAGAAPDEIVAAFRRLVLTLPPIQRNALALHASAGVPVPQFFQDAALLVRDGLFTTVLSSAFDALVERALAILGLRPGENLELADVGDEGLPERSESRGVTVVKLHGSRVPGPIEAPVLVVGHEADDPTIFDALTAGGGTVWWVAEQGLPEDLAGLEARREIVVIEGPGGHPDRFFGELAVLAVQMPTVHVVADPIGIHLKVGAVSLDRTLRSPSALLATIGGTAPPEDQEEFERQFLGGRMRRCEETLGRLTIQAAGGTLGQTLSEQLDYQKRELALLEEKLRGLDANRTGLLNVLDEILGAPEARTDHDASEFLEQTVDRITGEYRSESPNEDVVSAALAAVAVLGSRLRISRDLLQRLERFTPSAQEVAP